MIAGDAISFRLVGDTRGYQKGVITYVPDDWQWVEIRTPSGPGFPHHDFVRRYPLSAFLWWETDHVD